LSFPRLRKFIIRVNLFQN